jgi:hypothetical protein
LMEPYMALNPSDNQKRALRRSVFITFSLVSWIFSMQSFWNENSNVGAVLCQDWQGKRISEANSLKFLLTQTVMIS